MLRRNMTVIILSAIVSLACYEKAPRSRYAGAFVEALEQITTNYVEPIDGRQLFEGAIEGMIQRLDEYSAYVGPEEYHQLQTDLDQQFGGIGIVVSQPKEGERLIVMSTLVGAPAQTEGMRAGDTILNIDGQTTERFSFNDSIKLLRGKPGTSVSLTVLHDGEIEPVAIDITRALIKIDSVLGDVRRSDGGWSYFLEEDKRIGYLRITTFGEHTADELDKALDEVGDQAEALILDLRDNAGGLLVAAIETCDMFVDSGPIVTTRGRGGKVRKTFVARARNTRANPSIPMVVLVNKYSASASEIVAACLQDYQRAVVVGQRTWGKGTVQNVIPLEQGKSVLKLTTATYWRPSGTNIHRAQDNDEDDDWGVTANEGLEVNLDADQYKRLVLRRQRRDYPDARHMAVEPTASLAETLGNGPSPREDEPVDDPQLRKAVEHLQEQLAAEGRSGKSA